MPSASFTSSRSYVRRSRRKGNRIALPGVGRSRATGKNLKFVAACKDLLFGHPRGGSPSPGQYNVQNQQQAQPSSLQCVSLLFENRIHSFIQSKVAKFVQINCMLARYTHCFGTHTKGHLSWVYSVGVEWGVLRQSTHHGVRIIICNNKIKVRINWMVGRLLASFTLSATGSQTLIH